jgi:hypothetical protein
MLDWPARMKTFSGLANEMGDRTQSSAAVRKKVSFIVFYDGADSIVYTILKKALNMLDAV